MKVQASNIQLAITNGENNKGDFIASISSVNYFEITEKLIVLLFTTRKNVNSATPKLLV